MVFPSKIKGKLKAITTTCIWFGYIHVRRRLSLLFLCMISISRLKHTNLPSVYEQHTSEKNQENENFNFLSSNVYVGNNLSSHRMGPFKYPNGKLFYPFYTPNRDISTFCIPTACKKYPFRAEPTCIVHHREYPPPLPPRSQGYQGLSHRISSPARIWTTGPGCSKAG